MPIDLSLYLIVDGVPIEPNLCLPIITAALENGVTAVQLRQKNSSLRQKYIMAQCLRKVTLQYKVPLIINDHVDIAMAVDADGVHIGQQDLPCSVVRSLIGGDKIMGCSVASAKEYKNTDVAMLDYIGVGPVFKTNTKQDAVSTIGIPGITEIKALSGMMPIVAIGGIELGNIKQVRALGVGVAVSSAICSAKDIAKASQLLC